MTCICFTVSCQLQIERRQFVCYLPNKHNETIPIMQIVLIDIHLWGAVESKQNLQNDTLSSLIQSLKANVVWKNSEILRGNITKLMNSEPCEISIQWFLFDFLLILWRHESCGISFSAYCGDFDIGRSSFGTFLCFGSLNVNERVKFWFLCDIELYVG